MELSPLTPKELIKKDELTFDEALVVMRYFDGRIKEAAKNRLEKPEGGKVLFLGKTPDRIATTGIAGFVLSGIPTFISSMMVIVDEGITMSDPLFLISTSITVASTSMGVLGIMLDSYKNATDGVLFKKTRQKNLTKYEQELEAANRLYELKEKEYRKVLKKMAKPAHKAITVINSHLADEVVVYNDERGEEGFSRVPRFIPPKDEWEELAISNPVSKAFGKRPEAEVKGLLELAIPDKVNLTKEPEAISA